MTNHVITLYPALVKRLVARGWLSAYPFSKAVFYKRHNEYAYIVQVDFVQHRATFSRYERLSS